MKKIVEMPHTWKHKVPVLLIKYVQQPFKATYKRIRAASEGDTQN